MKPLNGKTRMTDDEKRNRRRELMSDPAYRALINASRRRWYRKNRQRLAEKERDRMESDPEYAERRRASHRKANRKYCETRRDRKNERGREYYASNRGKILEYWRKRRETPEGRAACMKAHGRRAERLRTDAAFRAAYNARCKRWRDSHPEYKRAKMEKAWEAVVAGGSNRIAVYMKRARPQNRHAFAIWYQKRAGLINRTEGRGHVEDMNKEEC